MHESWADSGSNTRLSKGLAKRRMVLGDEYVDHALSNMDSLSEPLQRMVTEFCWGEVWNREGLTLKTRSLLNIVMMTALNRPHELKIHLRGAFRNGCEELEISEAILQTAIYCGVPAAIDSMRIFRSVMQEMSEEKSK